MKFLEVAREALVTPFAFTLFSIAALLIVAFTAPRWVWAIPTFRKIRAVVERLEGSRVRLTYNGTYTAAGSKKVTSSRLSLYWAARSAKKFIEGQTFDLMRMFLVFSLTQIVLVLSATGEEFHLALHFPIGEAVLLLSFLYWSISFSLEWNGTVRDWFKKEVWKGHFS